MHQASKLSIFRMIPKTVWAIGFVTLLVNGSTIIVFSLAPLYLTSVLGVSLIYLGTLEGLVEATSWFTRIFSGVLSDYLHRRKPILIVAYSLAACSRFVFPLAPTANWIFLARFLERISNGLQATPREALIGDVAPAALKGACYGLRQTLGTVGSFAGALALWYFWKGQDYKLAFWYAGIPTLLAVVVLFIFVQDRIKDIPKEKTKRKLINFQEVKSLTVNYWQVVIIATLFMFSNYSGMFIILQGQKAGLCGSNISLVMVFQNIMTFLAAFPIGWLSDRIGRNALLMFGFILVIISNLLMTADTILSVYLCGVAIWGVQMGITQSLFVTKVADTAPEALRGTAFGIYYLLSGIAVFICNAVSGQIAHAYSHNAVFYTSSIMALMALIASLIWMPVHQDKREF
jgi:MFS family permease